MDTTRFFAALQLAQLRFNSDPSERNKEVLDQAQQDYDFVSDPEKKTEEGDQDPAPSVPKVVDEKPAPKPTPLKEGQPKPGTKKTKVPKEPAAPAVPAVTPEAPAQTEVQPGTDSQEENQDNQEKTEE